MKKIFMLMFCIVLLIGLVNATKINYENNDMEVDFKKSFLGIGTGDLGSIKLKSHNSVDEVRQVGLGEQVIMWYDFNWKELYKNGLGEIIITNMDTGEEIEKEYKFVYWGDEEYLEINQTKTRKAWIDYNSKDLPKGKITIGIEVDMKMDETIDIVWTIAGKKVKKHAIVSSGAVETIDGDFTVLTYSNNGTFNLTGDNKIVSVLVVAGGGGGGCGSGGGGGGGAGGIAYNESYNVVAGNYNITVGIGGIGSSSNNVAGGNGQNSSFDNVVAIDGGGGGCGAVDGADGGSGGARGSADAAGFIAGSGIQENNSFSTGFGNDGGFGIVAFVTGGGGGGASEIGFNGTVNFGGSGGNGTGFNITNGTTLFYGGGGGGGKSAGSSPGEGGLGGGGAGGATTGFDGIANTGGGGGGASDTIAKGGDGGSGIVIIRFRSLDLTITLNSPIDFFNSTNSEVNFNATVSSGEGIDNVSLFIDDVRNETNVSGISGVDYVFIKNLADGSHNWLIEACVTGENCANSSSRNLSVDANPPLIDIEAPNGTFDILAVNGNITLNFTVIDFDTLDTCLLDYNGTNTTIPCSNGTKVNTGFNYQEGFNNLTVYANDSIGNINSSFTFWDFKVLELNQTFNNDTTEGNLEAFEAEIKLKSGISITATSLIYNGTSNIGVSSLSGDITTLSVSDVLVPNVEAEANISLFWTILLSDSSIINLSTKNQTVFNLGMDNCSTFTNRILNFTSFDEELQTFIVNTTKEMAINVFSSDRTAVVINFSSSFDNNPTIICLNVNLTGAANYSLDALVRYQSEGYASEYYNIVDLELTSDTPEQVIKLFNLNQTDSTQFQLTFTGEDFLPVENALVFVERQYIAENTFKTVELPKTDSNGQTILHLVRNDIIYNIIIMKDKQVLGTFENLIAFCDDFSIGDCRIALNAIGEDTSVFNYNDEVGILFDSGPVFDNVTNTVSFSFTSTDGTSKIVTLDVERRDIFGNTSICSNVLVSSSGTVSCNTGNITEAVLVSNVSVNGQEWIVSPVIIDSQAYGSIGYVALFLLTLSLFLFLSDSRNGIIISTFLGYIASIALGWSIGGIIGIGSAGIWMIVLTIIAIYLINKNRNT